jgi:hypothetical protein
MVRFAEVFPKFGIVQTLSAQLGWSYFLEIIYLKDDLRRAFYAEMCRIERWSVRTLRSKIGGMLYERTALSKNTEEHIRQVLDALRDEDGLTPDLVFRDPYFLDILNLPGRYSEKIWKTRSCANWRNSCWNWAATSRSSRGRNGFPSGGMIFISTCCFIIAG